jgi:hypothetical protein
MNNEKNTEINELKKVNNENKNEINKLKKINNENNAEINKLKKINNENNIEINELKKKYNTKKIEIEKIEKDAVQKLINLMDENEKKILVYKEKSEIDKTLIEKINLEKKEIENKLFNTENNFKLLKKELKQTQKIKLNEKNSKYLKKIFFVVATVMFIIYCVNFCFSRLKEIECSEYEIEKFSHRITS